MKLPLALGAAALVALTGCGGGARAGDGANEREVLVEIRHSGFVPVELSVEAGTTVEFVVRNTDPIAHEFIIGDRGVQRVHERGTEAHHGAKPGEISIPAGEERSTTYTFTAPGTLIFGCHIAGHYKYGMRGLIDID